MGGIFPLVTFFVLLTFYRHGRICEVYQRTIETCRQHSGFSEEIEEDEEIKKAES